MAEDSKPDESKQEAQTADSRIAQPATTAPQQPPSGAHASDTGNNQNPAQPILVRLIGKDDLEPFEEQTLAIARDTLAISRKTYWIAIFGFLAALAAAIFVGSQVKIMSYQTQVMGSQSESAAAGALFDQMNTRKQLAIAQQQAVAAQQSAKASEDSVKTLKRQFEQDQRPYIAFVGVTNFSTLDETGNFIDTQTPQKGRPLMVTLVFKNVGKSPAINLSDHRHILIGPTGVLKAKIIEPLEKTGGETVEVGGANSTTAVYANDPGEAESAFMNLAKAPIWDGSQRIILFGRFTYEDRFHNHYCTSFMKIYLPNSRNWATVSGANLCPPGYQD